MKVKTDPAPIIQKKKGRVQVAPPVTAAHELTVKFTELLKPKIGEREIHNITVKLDDLTFYVKISLKKKQ